MCLRLKAETRRRRQWLALIGHDHVASRLRWQELVSAARWCLPGFALGVQPLDRWANLVAAQAAQLLLQRQSCWLVSGRERWAASALRHLASKWCLCLPPEAPPSRQWVAPFGCRRLDRAATGWHRVVAAVWQGGSVARGWRRQCRRCIRHSTAPPLAGADWPLSAADWGLSTGGSPLPLPPEASCSLVTR